ncbi:hypothetical protein A2X44_00555 [candidate division CPR3 bacterium GWF2_35_18]|uniref:tetrahydrofolate synthase n=1 Tax=candidate division CPR3 bacterium GW2011_GWF2_35_18 TaxID=1618350 RepID=A0A0G0E4B8_UNCC3|nr:MAG: FolC bifunctional protein [candidate division CPR3 bacterium GW2011_GWF2_35_18]OGB63405.1 MAG: hypothetical protein A2X44_00555 [candidate division CPR3 bacterium GWF2_35_18]OGB64850.1 MAG: hypothetical protein A2250_05475 [candidate division CPR3 bacterium RIFOXYA2_FULL_35_13]OGB76119.1 MAG: hypothetical protein A2476_05595 [candidate division CPR3 bacterium RIFOXYC2_FULL_35_7]OGB78970.1 MAG: hypothetical protein A2296_04580 [candidate division CPR3 bacterium RIFOXYB2_FULL_35_8]
MRLERISFFLSLLNNPHQKLKYIHVGGTAGKGSTSFITASILEAVGYKVGLTISPHLQKITERILLNRTPISDDQFIYYVNRLKPVIERVKIEGKWGYPSYFEILIALSFMYFYENKVDIAVIEVGLGGNLDATNVIKPEVSIVTNIGWDHMDWLGNSLVKIATEKAGIIKPSKIAVTGVTQKNIKRVIMDKAKELNADLLVLGKDFKVKKHQNSFDYFFKNTQIKNLKLSLQGDFQITNTVLAITAIKSLSSFNVSDDTIRKALLKLHFPGRLESVNIRDKTFIIDGAHNPMKMKALVSSLKKIFPNQKFPIVISIKKDKDYRKILDLLLPIASEFIVTEFEKVTDTGVKLARKSKEIISYINKIDSNIKVTTTKNAMDTFHAMQRIIDNHILVTGSLYLVGEIREVLGLKWDIR